MNALYKLSLTSLLTLLFFSCTHKETSTNTPEMSDYEKFISEMHANGFTTGNILVYENGEIIHQSSNGLRSIDPVDSLTLNSQFRLASVSKQFTGVAIMKLKQAGKIEYHQKVNTILPDFPYDNITIEHLLRHISGLADYEAIVEEHFIPKDEKKRYILGNDEILELFFEAKPELIFQPGEQWEYSNTGYLVLASIVEKVSNQHFSQFLEENIFKPLGMDNTVLYKYKEGEDANMPNRVFGYYKALNQKDLISNDYDIVNDVRGDGGIYSTLNDLFKWNMALANYEVMPKEYMDEAWSWGTLNNGEKTRYGFGWIFHEGDTIPKKVYHSGGWVGFGTYLYNDFTTKSGYVVLTNNTFESLIAITDAIDSIRVGAPYELQKKSIGRGMAERIFSENMDAAVDFYHQHKTDTSLYQISENELNSLGYELLNGNHVDEAVLVFKLNLDTYASANTYDSYGDGLLMKGDSIQALEQFKTAFKMDSSFTYTAEKISNLEKK